ncbi:MAG TPA: GNAT family N-acetyltransferase [Acidimicrobiales bacterium]
MPHVAARPATPDDLAAVAALVADAAAEKAEQKGGAVWYRRERRQDPPEARLAAALASADDELVVGTLDGAVLGYAAARVEKLADGGLLGVLDELYVDPEAREVGLGEALMDHVLAWCRERGCFGLDSLALPGDRATKNFFESFGLVARAIVVHRPLT